MTTANVWTGKKLILLLLCQNNGHPKYRRKEGKEIVRERDKHTESNKNGKKIDKNSRKEEVKKIVKDDKRIRNHNNISCEAHDKYFSEQSEWYGWVWVEANGQCKMVQPTDGDKMETENNRQQFVLASIQIEWQSKATRICVCSYLRTWTVKYVQAQLYLYLYVHVLIYMRVCECVCASTWIQAMIKISSYTLHRFSRLITKFKHFSTLVPVPIIDLFYFPLLSFLFIFYFYSCCSWHKCMNAYIHTQAVPLLTCKFRFVAKILLAYSNNIHSECSFFLFPPSSMSLTPYHSDCHFHPSIVCKIFCWCSHIFSE